MRPSKLAILLSRIFPSPFRQLISFSARGYLPGAIRRHWISMHLACELFKNDGLPIYRSPYKLYVPPDLIHMYIHHYGFLDYEPLTHRVFLDSLKPGFVVLDIGAHFGYYALLGAGTVGSMGKVHAVEAAPENLAVLEHNVRVNKLENVEIHRFAAGSTRGTQVLNVSAMGVTAFDPSGPQGAQARIDTKVEVPIVPLDKLIQGPVHLAKIDVDGSELTVLEGMKRILSENKEMKLLVEWAPSVYCSDRNPLDIPTWLEGAGFNQIDVLADWREESFSIRQATEMLDQKKVARNQAFMLFAKRIGVSSH